MGHFWVEINTQSDPAKLKVFMNDRLAETWEDATMRSVRYNAIQERAEPYLIRVAPKGVLWVTAGVDTQDDRLALHLSGWGRGMGLWALDYHEFPGDPADDAVWVALTEYLNRPIQSEAGYLLGVDATAIDMAGHRSEEVKHWVRLGLVRRPMVIQGAVPNNAPVLGKPRLLDVTRHGQTDRKGVRGYYVGTVAAKNWLFGRLSVDAEREPEKRCTHFSQELDQFYFKGLVSETFDPAKNRYEKKRGARNEPLDTAVYSFAAAHHPELRLHRKREIDYQLREQFLESQLAGRSDGVVLPIDASSPLVLPAPKPLPKKRSVFAPISLS